MNIFLSFYVAIGLLLSGFCFSSPNHSFEYNQVLNFHISFTLQDALEFFHHLIDKVDQANPGNHELDPSTGFKFIIEERVQCPSGKVSYNKHCDNFLSLSIPLHEATNKGGFKKLLFFCSCIEFNVLQTLTFVGCAEQLEAFHEKKAAMDLDGKEV